MNDNRKLSLREFLSDIKLVVTSPAHRFAVIHERGALWGSLLLLIVPAYFGFHLAGGVYFHRDPFPGYSFIIPAILAVGIILIKAYPIHFFARLLEGRGKYSRGNGTFRELMAVIGYTSVPQILAVLLFLLLFLLIPEQIGSLYRSFRIACITILVAAGSVLFIWALILAVLALRRVYRIRDAKIVLALFLGTVVSASISLSLLFSVMVEVEVSSVYLQPVFSQRVLRFFSSDPLSGISHESKIEILIDRMVYRFKSPERFDLVSYYTVKKEPHPEKDLAGPQTVQSLSGTSADRREELVGRIVGMPGESVEFVLGRLRINRQYWDEPYIAPEYRSNSSLLPQHLASTEYLICPEDRRLGYSHRHDFVVQRDRIAGRAIVNKWPLGWWLFRPSVFLRGHPAS